MKIVITIIIAILVIGVVGFFFYEGQREARYKDCLGQCEDSIACLERSINPATKSAFDRTICTKSFSSNCKFMCIEKYK